MVTKKSLSSLKEADLKGKKVFVRVDLNVPLADSSKIIDETRIHVAIPIVKYLMSNRARLILYSHQVEITQKIHMDGEVNRARCMPQIPSIIAAKTSSFKVYVFDSTKQQLNHEGGSCELDVKLRGHNKEGYGL